MLTLCGQPRSFCDGVNRRDFLYVGRRLAMLAVVATWLLSAAPGAAQPAKKGEQALTLAEAKKDADGFLAHAVAPKDQDAMAQIKVLLPDNLKEGQRYPVLYLEHSGGETDEGWSNEGRVNVILDNMVAANKVKPMIVVMPAGEVNVSFARDKLIEDVNTFDDEFIKDIVPYVEKNYRVIADKQHRAVAGAGVVAVGSGALGAGSAGFFSVAFAGCVFLLSAGFLEESVWF